MREATGHELAAKRRALWHAALVTSIPNLLLAGLGLALDAPSLMIALLLVHAVLAAGIGLAARAQRRRSGRWISTADALLFAPYYATIWAGQEFLGRVAYDPLFASKLLAVGLAAIVPSSFRLHLALMAGLVAQATAIWLNLSRGEVPRSAEPWITALFFLVAGWFLVARWQQHEFEKEFEELRVKTAVLTHVAQAFVAVRHLANTPLQKLALLTTMLAQGAPATPARLAALGRAVRDLEGLLAEFRHYEDVVDQTDDEISFDAYAKLASLRGSRSAGNDGDPAPHGGAGSPARKGG